MESIIGIDLASWLAVGEGLGCHRTALLVLLPFIESGILSGIADTQDNGR